MATLANSAVCCSEMFATLASMASSLLVKSDSFPENVVAPPPCLFFPNFCSLAPLSLPYLYTDNRKRFTFSKPIIQLPLSNMHLSFCLLLLLESDQQMSFRKISQESASRQTKMCCNNTAPSTVKTALSDKCHDTWTSFNPKECFI